MGNGEWGIVKRNFSSLLPSPPFPFFLSPLPLFPLTHYPYPLVFEGLMTAKTSQQAMLRHLPSVDQLLRAAELSNLRESIGTARLTAVARGVLHELRSQLRSDGAAAQLNKDDLWAQTIERIRYDSNDESLTT